MVYQVGVDCVLQVSAPIVGQQDVDDLGPGVGAIAGVGNRIVDGADDVLVWSEERICLRLLECLGDGFLAERAADLLQGEELAGACVLDEVDIGEAALKTS